MLRKNSYFEGLSADFSRPALVTDRQHQELGVLLERLHTVREKSMPPVDAQYPLEVIEQENREWFPTHCSALRRERFDLLNDEYRDEFVYLCQDGPFRGKGAASVREENWVAIIAQPGVTMNWPIVQFSGEVVYFEWAAIADGTGELVAKGNVTFLRRGHRGGIYLKTEQLTFYRDVCAARELLEKITA